MSFNFQIENCGRVKLAGGTFSTYYDLASSLIGNEHPSAEQIINAQHNFKNIRKTPPVDLLLAFFPDDFSNIQYRLRGAGAYRHLRMDQGPGGNFTRFDVTNDATLDYNITREQGFAMPEELIRQQLDSGNFPQLQNLEDEIQNAFECNDYRKTSILVNKFKTEAEASGLMLHDGTHVGSKSGFFFIRPAETEQPTRFPLEKIPALREKIDEALNKSLSLAEYTRHGLKQNLPFTEAVARAERQYQENGGTNYTDRGTLYFQPDCFVDNQGNIEVEKINMPDVGLFMTLLNRPQNACLNQVVKANLDLKDRIKKTAASFLEKDCITLITREEVLTQKADTLEILEIKALRNMLQELGKTVEIKTLSDYNNLNKQSEILLLNVDNRHPDFGKFTETIVRQDLNCYADPLLYYFKDRATTLKTMQIPGKNLEQFLQLIKPKDITAKNAENIYQRLQYLMKRFDMNEDILYANISGYKMPIPVFKYSLHSFGQIHKAYEKIADKNATITLSAVPTTTDNAIFHRDGQPRLSAFRFMCTKER